MRSRIVLIAGTLLVLGASVAVVFAVIESDEDRIERLVEEMRDAALARDTAGVLGAVATDVEFPGGMEALERRLDHVFRRYPPESIMAEVLNVEVDGDRAEAEIEVWYRTSEFGAQPFRTTIKAKFGRRDGRWLVVGLSHVGG